MPQALHGGDVSQAFREFGVPAGEILDYSANINALAPSIAQERWADWLSAVIRYPEVDGAGVRQKLAEAYEVSPELLLPTAGAIEGLYLVARLFPGDRVAVIEPAFSDYTRAFEAAGCAPERISLPVDLWCRPAEEWGERLEPFDVIILGNPNNPTGAMQTRNQLAALFKRDWQRPKSWIVDEAFIEFATGNESLLGELSRHPRVVVLRSLTKSWGIPGLRLGFVATSHSGWLAQLGTMQPPWSINAVAARWALEFLSPEAHRKLLEGISQLREIGERFDNGLAKIRGLKLHPSNCNFRLIELADPALDSDAVYQAMGRRGILVRRCDSFYGIPKGRFIRLAVRGEIENNRVLEALGGVCQELSEKKRRGAG